MVAVSEKIAVQPFSYPVSLDTIKAVRDEMVLSYAKLLREEDVYRNPALSVLSLNIQGVVTEALTLFTAELLLQKGTPEQIENYRPAMLLKDGGQAASSVFVDKSGISSFYTPKWKIPFRLLKNFLHPDAIPYKPFQFNRRSDTLTLSNAPLILDHWRESKVRLIRNDFSDWFKPGQSASGYSLNQHDQKILADIAGIFHARGLPFSDPTALSLKQAYAKLAAMTADYLAQAQQKSRYIPDTLWLGTAGMLPARVLAHVARQNGRFVCGHDHGTGSGWLQTLDQTVVEFNYMDAFYTFTPLMAQGLRRHLRNDCLFNTGFSEKSIISRKSPERPAAPYPKFLRRPVKKCLFVATFYMKDTMDFIPRMPFDVSIEWHSKLFARLSQAGYEVTYRPHPEDCYLGSVPLQDWNIRIDQTRRLSEACEQADCVILDFSCTTALVELLKSGIPIVLLDSGHEKVDAEALERLKRSTAYIPLHYDQGQAVVMPEDLDEILKTLHLRDFDSSFLEYFE